jgi:CheY-like chemotaxis protein
VIVEIRGEDSHVSLVVRDTGIGIARDFLPYVFDRFRQADASTARRFGGLGLGLALVRHVVEMHGGTAEVASEGEDRGAIFTIRMPAAAHAPQAVPREGATKVRPAQETPLAGVRVLVVDDEPDGIDFLAVALGISGAEVTGARSGDEVLRRLFDANDDGAGYDLLLADVGMPEMDGYTLVRRIRAMNGTPTAAVPAIAITAYTRSEDRAAALEAGFDAHVAKPVDPRVLVDLICALLGRREQAAGEQVS